MGGEHKPGPMCTTRGSTIDAGTRCRNLTPAPGSTCTQKATQPIPERLERALGEFESAGINFATRSIHDENVRLDYFRKIRTMSGAVLEDVRQGKITAEQGQTLAQQLRNEIMETERWATSDVGRAWAVKRKPEGKALPWLQEYYARNTFSRSFETLSEPERNEVFLTIVKSSGRAEKGVMETTARLGRYSRGLLFLTAGVAVYQVATSDRPGREAVKQGVVLGVGYGGGAVAASLVCGPAAPVCVGIFVFVGGAAAAYFYCNRWLLRFDAKHEFPRTSEDGPTAGATGSQTNPCASAGGLAHGFADEPVAPIHLRRSKSRTVELRR